MTFEEIKALDEQYVMHSYGPVSYTHLSDFFIPREAAGFCRRPPGLLSAHDKKRKRRELFEMCIRDRREGHGLGRL